MRPTNFCHLVELRLPVPRAFLVRSAAFTAWTPHGVLGSVRLTRGPSASRHSWTLQRIAAGHTLPCLLNSLAPRDAGALERGCCLPTAPIAIEPLTPLSPLPAFEPANRRCAFAQPSSSSPCGLFRFSRVREPPRLPWPPPRERRWLVTTRSAFHRQGPFVGSDGHYSPGPATAPPLSRCDDRWTTFSRHPGSRPVLHLVS